MRGLLIVVFLAAAAYLGYYSYNQRQQAEEIAALQEKKTNNLTIKCYFCGGGGQYTVESLGRTRSTPCAICNGKGNRQLRRVPNTFSICGGDGNGANTCGGMGKLAREVSKNIGSNKIASNPNGHSRYLAIGCTNCSGKGVVK